MFETDQMNFAKGIELGKATAVGGSDK